MVTKIVLPRLGMVMEEGTVACWHVQEGQWVEKGTEVVEIETDKLAFQIEAIASGFLHIIAPAGSVVPVGEMLGMLAVNHEEYQSLLEESPTTMQVTMGTTVLEASGLTVGPTPTAETEEPATSAEDRQEARSERISASPVARKLAEEHKIDLSKIRGTGPGGRIVKEDVLEAIERQTVPAPPSLRVPPQEPMTLAIPQRRIGQIIPLTGARKATADHMLKSLQTSAQLTFMMEADLTELVDLRQHLVAESEHLGVRISYNALFARAIIKALREWPIFNSSIEGDEIKVYENINIGIAMAVNNSLIVPVVHDADRMSLFELGQAIAELVERARGGALNPDDLAAGTFTLTNLGHFEVDGFTPILHSPETAILGVGRIAERAVVMNGQLAIRSTAVLSLTCDHRVADGVPCARFLQTIKGFLQRPWILLA